jgi:hypothetical protein
MAVSGRRIRGRTLDFRWVFRATRNYYRRLIESKDSVSPLDVSKTITPPLSRSRDPRISQSSAF